MDRALVTGITGQDGRHLAQLLNSKGYEVWGLVRSQSESKLAAFGQEYPYVQVVEGDLCDFSSLVRALEISQPTEVYNLGALSFVGLSFKQPEVAANVTGVGALRLLEAVRMVMAGKDVKVYQASSSEMFGHVRETPQSESTPFHPRSPYGTAKAFAHYTCVNYREAYGLHVSCGILFNHEGPLRGHEFVTRKISSGVARISLGMQQKIVLGNLEARRDWGFAPDYVEAMWLMLQQDSPRDFVIATGRDYSVADFARAALSSAGLEPDIDRYVETDSRLLRPAEVERLIGDASLARKELGWQPSTGFEEMVDIMVANDLALEASRLRP